MKPRIAVTMGDPAGIGPEVCLRLLKNSSIADHFEIVIFGDAAILQRVARHLRLPMPQHIVTADQLPSRADTLPQNIVVDLDMLSAEDVQPGVVDSKYGLAAYRYIETAIDAALAGDVDAVTTAPIHKEALRGAGIPYAGHTEIFADKTGSRRWCMMLTSPELTCSFVTAHVGYRQVPDLLSVDRIVEVIELSHEAIGKMRGRPGKLALCGLNPHAGEHGLFGNGEEERIILPAACAARDRGIDIEGPLPPDTAFLPQRRRRTDCFVCMYHDQGHIPLKALAFDVAVNVTLGLPIIRTSVDHGTAFDIAWKGEASESSLIEAVKLAGRLAEAKTPIGSMPSQ
ncbi:MAG: 4-hydroxythreonine-4-phosphate dehydrogenase [Gemmatales bacterium]|nr:MAG: 4-hydroxythreonine-4-phosphate dehydrogenase [Gemmatales bacterium]